MSLQSPLGGRPGYPCGSDHERRTETWRLLEIYLLSLKRVDIEGSQRSNRRCKQVKDPRRVIFLRHV